MSGKFWLFVLAASGLIRARDKEHVQLAADDVITILPGDRITIGPVGDNDDPDQKILCRANALMAFQVAQK